MSSRQVYTCDRCGAADIARVHELRRYWHRPCKEDPDELCSDCAGDLDRFMEGRR